MSLRGAPGGDDYQNLWINPENPNIILLVSDQGALVSVNRGETWSSWYNQPTAQLYHVAATNTFPYQVCAGQQESGSVCIASRGNDGEITYREWHPVAVIECGYVAPDPLHPEIHEEERREDQPDREQHETVDAALPCAPVQLLVIHRTLRYPQWPRPLQSCDP